MCFQMKVILSKYTKDQIYSLDMHNLNIFVTQIFTAILWHWFKLFQVLGDRFYFKGILKYLPVVYFSFQSKLSWWNSDEQENVSLPWWRWSPKYRSWCCYCGNCCCCHLLSVHKTRTKRPSNHWSRWSSSCFRGSEKMLYSVP